jgi:hypothetical protein
MTVVGTIRGTDFTFKKRHRNMQSSMPVMCRQTDSVTRKGNNRDKRCNFMICQARLKTVCLATVSTTEIGEPHSIPEQSRRCR